MNYYRIVSGAGVGGWAGIAYIKDYNEINLLPKQGWVKDWVTKHFILKNGEYTDYLPVNIGCRLCSEKMHDILEKYKSKKDVIQWLDAEVETETGEERKYYILHFPELKDLLDKKKSKYARNVLTKQIIDAKACIGHEVFSYKECPSLSFVVSEKAREELKKENCRGLIYLNASSLKKSHLPKIIQRLFCYKNKKNAMKKAGKQREISRQNIGLTNLKNLNLPNDLVDFIREYKFLCYDEEKCIIGKVELVSVDSLISGRIYVEPKRQSSKKGYYTIPAVDLIAECKGFDAWGILVWLPDIKMYGTWDSNHRKLRVFHDAVWNDIMNNPIKYLNALWNPQEVKNSIFEPDDKYPFTEEP